MTALTDSPFDSANCSYKYHVPSSKASWMLIARAMPARKRLHTSKADRKENKREGFRGNMTQNSSKP